MSQALQFSTILSCKQRYKKETARQIKDMRERDKLKIIKMRGQKYCRSNKRKPKPGKTFNAIKFNEQKTETWNREGERVGVRMRERENNFIERE